MIKFYRKTLLAIVCLLSSIRVSAYDFEVDGIYYEVVSSSDLTCKVVNMPDDKEYSGDIVIPEHVKKNNNTFTVVEIGEGAFESCDWLKSIF